MTTSSVAIRRASGRWERLPVAPTLLALASTCWAVGFAAYRLQLWAPPGPHKLAQVAFYGWPIALVIWTLFRRSTSRFVRIAALVTAAIAIAFLTVPKLDSSATHALAVPALALGFALAVRWPALLVLIGVTVSSAFGDLEVYWHFPTQKLIDALLISLLLAALAVARTGRRAVIPRPMVLVLVGYLFITAVMVALAPDRSIALHDFSTTSLYFLTALVVAHANWPDRTYWTIGRGLMLAAFLVGAYATLRMIIGPSAKEFLGNQSSFDYVNGHYRAIGSFHSPQDLALWTSAVIPFTFAWTLGTRGRSRLLGLAASVLLAIGLYGSGGRSGILAAGAGLIAVLLLHHFARGLRGLRLGVTLAAVILTVGSAAVLFTVVHSTDATHGYNALLHPFSDPSFIDRRTKWAEALRELRGHPFGYGMGSAYYLQAADHLAATNIGYDAIDNGYLFVALEQGLVVMGIFIAGLFGLLIELGRGSIVTAGRMRAILGMGAAGTLVSLMVSAVVETPGQSPRLLTPCIIIGVGLAQFAVRRPGDQEP